MKRLLFALFLLWPGIAFAQVGPEVYTVATPAHVIGFNSSTSVTITSHIVNRIIRTTCSAACFIWVNSSGQSFPVSKSTGVFLPANVPTLQSVSPNSKVRIIGDSGAGTVYIQELSR